MLRLVYRLLVRCHPPRFRERFGEEMEWIFEQASGVHQRAGLLADGAVSVVRQWAFRADLRDEPVTAGNGAPAFQQIENPPPPVWAVGNGMLVTVAAFALLGFSIGRDPGFPVNRNTGFLTMEARSDRQGAPAGLSAEKHLGDRGFFGFFAWATPVTGRLEGVVLDDATGTPVPHAEVRLIPDGNRGLPQVGARTDASGRFRLEELMPADYRLVTKEAGYVERHRLEAPMVTVLPDASKEVAVRLTPGAVITGRVVDREGKPLAGASVSATISGSSSESPRPSVGARSDDRGEYRIYGLEPGEYELFAHLPMREGEPQTAEATLRTGEHLTGIDFRLPVEGKSHTDYAVVAGRVVDEQGKPMEGVKVGAFCYRFMEFRRRFLPCGGESMTDDLGEYRRLMRPGEYYLVAMVSLAPLSVQRDKAYRPLFHPGAGEVSEAVTLRVAAGEERRVDFRMVPEPAHLVEGRVVNEAGHTVREVTVTLTPLGTELFPPYSGGSRVSSDPGDFRFGGLVAGDYILEAVTNGPADQRWYGSMKVTVKDSNVGGLKVVIRPAVSVRGKGKVEGTPGHTGFEKMSVALLPIIPHTQFARGSSAEVQDDGSFEITGVAPASYRLGVFDVPSGFYLDKGTYRGKDAFVSVNIESGESHPLEVTLGRRPARVEGLVFDDNGAAAPGVLVLLRPATEGFHPLHLSKWVRTDSAGRFVIPDVAPGEYYAVALGRGDPRLGQVPHVERPYPKEMVTVRLAEGQREKMQLRVAGTGE